MLPTITRRSFRPFYVPNIFDEDFCTKADFEYELALEPKLISPIIITPFLIVIHILNNSSYI